MLLLMSKEMLVLDWKYEKLSIRTLNKASGPGANPYIPMNLFYLQILVHCNVEIWNSCILVKKQTN